jgi:hypothetical protein
MTTVSKEFRDAVRVGSTIRATCGLCGRECFEDSKTAGTWEEGELEELRQKAHDYPDKFIAMEYVETGVIDGKEVVVNCPCNMLHHSEEWIWKHRHIIARYLAAITKKKAEEAYTEEAEAEELETSVALVDKKLTFLKCVGCGGYFPEELLTAQHGKFFCQRCVKVMVECTNCHQYIDKDEMEFGLCKSCAEAEEAVRASEQALREAQEQALYEAGQAQREREMEEEKDLPF